MALRLLAKFPASLSLWDWGLLCPGSLVSLCHCPEWHGNLTFTPMHGCHPTKNWPHKDLQAIYFICSFTRLGQNIKETEAKESRSSPSSDCRKGQHVWSQMLCTDPASHYTWGTVLFCLRGYLIVHRKSYPRALPSQGCICRLHYKHQELIAFPRKAALVPTDESR